MTDVQTQNGQLVSVQRQEKLEHRRDFGSDRDIKLCGNNNSIIGGSHLQRVRVEEFDGAVQQRDS